MIKPPIAGHKLRISLEQHALLQLLFPSMERDMLVMALTTIRLFLVIFGNMTLLQIVGLKLLTTLEGVDLVQQHL